MTTPDMLSPLCPPVLQKQVRRAAKMSHALALLADSTPVEDPSHTWLIGRADEVRAVVGTVTREWSERRVDATRAAVRIHDYLRDLEESHSAFVRSSDAAPRSETRPRSDTLIELDHATVEVERARVLRRA